jgi:hypothetical protein
VLFWWWKGGLVIGKFWFFFFFGWGAPSLTWQVQLVQFSRWKNDCIESQVATIALFFPSYFSILLRIIVMIISCINIQNPMPCYCYYYLGPFLRVQEDAQGRNGLCSLGWPVAVEQLLLWGAAGEQGDRKVVLLDDAVAGSGLVILALLLAYLNLPTVWRLIKSNHSACGYIFICFPCMLCSWQWHMCLAPGIENTLCKIPTRSLVWFIIVTLAYEFKCVVDG